MAKGRDARRLAGVPASVNTISFAEAFASYLDGVQKVHGAETAEAYRAIREGEAIVMDRMGVDYPDSQGQQRDFLSLHIEG